MTDEKQEVNLDEDSGPDGRMTMAEARAATTQPHWTRDRAYVLMPPWLVDQTLRPEECDELDADDPEVQAHWFSLTGWDWYVLAYDPEHRIAQAFVTSPMCPEGEEGSVDVAELEATRFAGLPAVERDLLFHMCPLSKARAHNDSE